MLDVMLKLLFAVASALHDDMSAGRVTALAADLGILMTAAVFTARLQKHPAKRRDSRPPRP